ncbi:hypothetical protein [Arthrobacter rhizosphaerae]|uniref:hypothetical protein n=1 Tax=Arthrobacter rhizosphaerae TaxID=2855490 RepID=UPI001FF5D018|nr:hypothetical protein [Arthrobacter rhizosphaerae]
MDFFAFINGFLAWSQTPLGANIVGPLVVVLATATGIFLIKCIRSVPDRFDRWLKRRVGLI